MTVRFQPQEIFDVAAFILAFGLFVYIGSLPPDNEAPKPQKIAFITSAYPRQPETNSVALTELSPGQYAADHPAKNRSGK